MARTVLLPMLLAVLSSLLVLSPLPCSCASTAAVIFRGVAPQDKALYSGKTVTCRDGSKTIPIAKVNDDFCDCADGTDEPGTSACPTSKFYCRNRGHEPTLLFSSRVNDGICDCCDGSDEWDGWVRCNATCAEAGAEARKELAALVHKYSEGAKLREAVVTGAAEKRKQWEEEKAKLEAEKAELEQKEHALKVEKEGVEKQEKEEKEWLERLRREQEEREKIENEGRTPKQHEPQKEQQQQPAGEGVTADVPSTEAPAQYTELSEEDRRLLEEEDAEVAAIIAAEERKKEEAAAAAEQEKQTSEDAAPGSGDGNDDEDLSHLSKEEMGRRIAERWTGHHDDHDDGGEHGTAHDEHGKHGEHRDDDVEQQEPYDVEPEVDDDHDHDDDDDDDDLVDDDDHKYMRHEEEEKSGDGGKEDDDDDDIDADVDDDGDKTEDDYKDPDPAAVSPRATWWARVLQWPRDVCSSLYSLFAKPPPLTLDKSRAARVKKQHSEVSQKLAKTTSRLRTIDTKLKNDYGPDGEFIDLMDKCFSYHVHQYEYVVCPYKDVVQKEHGSHTTVGRWRGFTDGHTAMKFGGGDHCWNGPSRSIKVSMECGVTTEVLSVDEPSRCEYHAVMTTPAMCTTDKAKEFQQELERREYELKSHDEL